MRERADEIIKGIRILRYILHPEKVVIAIEDNKPEAISAIRTALQGANDISIRVIPTKYPFRCYQTTDLFAHRDRSAKRCAFIQHWRINAKCGNNVRNKKSSYK